MAKIKFGMPSLIELNSLNEQVDLCKRLGLNFIELNMDDPNYTLDKLDYKILKQISKEKGTTFTLHIPEKIDLGYFDKVMRRSLIDYCKKTLQLCKKAGITLINLHLRKGTHFTLPQGKVNLYEKYEKEFLEKISESFTELSKFATTSGVKINIENACTFQFSFIEKAIDKIIKLPNIYLTWDSGHDALSNFREQKVLMKHKQKIKHVHLHDFNGKLDHQELYTGNVEIDKILTFAKKQSASVVIETKTVKALEKSVEKLKKKQEM